jgi:hypothetical protein
VGGTGPAAQAGSSARAAGQLPPESTLVFVVNPSQRVHKAVFRHAREIVQATARPRMRLVGIYEQETTDDGPPYDRHFLSELGPGAQSKRPAAPKLEDCSKFDTGHNKRKCAQRNTKKEEEHRALVRRWEAHLTGKVSAWRERVVQALSRVEARNPTRESSTGLWDLRGALMRTGTILASRPTPARCVVLLGGLAVKPPPNRWPTRDLNGATLIAAGWRGTPAVQDAWNSVLTPAGAKIKFLPGDVTDLDLVASVRSCLAGPPAAR